MGLREYETMRRKSLEEDLIRRILKGLLYEWKASLWVLPSNYRDLMKPPMLRLNDMRESWGYWNPEKREICISRDLVFNYSWASVREVLLHEIAHQFACEVLGCKGESPHGPTFQRACFLLRANPKASGKFKLLDERVANKSPGQEEKILQKIRKLLALAESQNQHEAEVAMLKAQVLIRKYNVEIIELDKKRNFVSTFLGKPALRHPREEYHLATLIQDQYFVQGIWIPAYVLEKEKMGRVLEITGILRNVQLAAYLYDFVHSYINQQWERYNRDRRLNRYRKTDFAIGIIEGFRSKLEEQRKVKTGLSKRNSLMRISDPRLDEYMSYKYPSTSKFRRNGKSNLHIYKDGMRLGKQMIVYKGIISKHREKRLALEG